MKDIVPRGFDLKIEEIQENHRQAIEEKDATIALLNGDLRNCEWENSGLQGEIRAKTLRRRFMFQMKTRIME